MKGPRIEDIDGKAADITCKLRQGSYYIMETKINQETLFNPTTTKEINTINLEQISPLTEHTLGPTHRTLSTPKSEAISDPGSISTTKLFTKPIVFRSNVEWDVTDTTNTILYDNSLLAIFQTLEQSPGGQALRANTFFRSGAKIQLKVSSSPFHSGKLVMYYIPPGNNITQFRNTIFSKVQFPCVYVDAGNSTTAELDIPFVAIKDFFATYNPDGDSDFGSVQIAVLNPLAIGTGGPTSVTFALSLHPTENQIALPVLAHTIELQAAILPIIADLIPAAMESLPGMVGSAVAGGGIGALGAGLISEAVDSETKTWRNNLDKKPQNQNNTPPSLKDLNISAPSLSNMVGYGTEHLSLHPTNTYVKTPHGHSPFDDEMDLLHIARIPSLLRQTTWTDTDSPGTLLFYAPISPMTCPYVPGSIDNQGTYSPTYLSHVTQPFCYWRGSIDYHFTFASTEQHRGKVIVAWIPYDSIVDTPQILGTTPTIQQLSLFPNEIFDLALNKEFSFSVPYNTETPYRQVSRYHMRVRQDSFTFSDAPQSQCLGTIVMLVYNTLSHPNTVSADIEMNTYISAGQDYQVRSLRFTSDTDNYQSIGYIQLQSLEVAMESSRGGMLHSKSNRVGVNNAYINSASYLDDGSEHNLQMLLSKYYPQVGFRANIGSNNSRRVRIASVPGLVNRAPRDTTNNRKDPQWRNLIAHFRDIYAFWHGSLNYFVIHDSTVNTPILLTVTHNPLELTLGNTSVVSATPNQQNSVYAPLIAQVDTRINYDETAAYSHMSNIRVNPTVEVTTPYRSIFRRLYCKDNSLSANDYPDQTECIGVLDLVYTNPSSDDIPISGMVYQSVGSDFRFKYLIPPPTIVTGL